MGTLFIRELPVHCVIGVHPHERASRQQLLINVTLTTSFVAAATSDTLEDATDYVDLAARIEQFAIAGRFRLIETLAERLADHLFDEDVARIDVEVWKPAALPGSRLVGVATSRQRQPGPG